MEYVKEIDDLIKINTVFATATEKGGLVSKERNDGTVIKGMPSNGLLGVLFDINPKAMVISTGGTAKLISGAGYDVIPIGDFTGWPEMETGLVKSMNPKLYVGMLAHHYTESDREYMAEHGLDSVDMVLVNYYPFEQKVKENPIKENPSWTEELPSAFEIIRQHMDVGGPTATHTSRKGFLGTAIATRPEDYIRFVRDMKKYNGFVSLGSRFKAMQNASEDFTQYMVAINGFIQSVKLKDVKAAYPVIHKPAWGK